MLDEFGVSLYLCTVIECLPLILFTFVSCLQMANPHEPHFLKPLLPHEGDMVFHVTPFGPSCCEIQYTHPHIIKEEAEADDAADDVAGDADDNEHHHKISKFQSKFTVIA